MQTTSHPTFRFSDIRLTANRDTRNLLGSGQLTLTYNGRGALYQVLSAMRSNGRSQVLVPAFHCPSVVDPVIHAGLEPVYYGIQSDLSIDTEDLRGKLNAETAALIVVHYFGFPPDLEPVRSACHSLGIPLIEDCAHSFLAANPLRLAGGSGDAVVYSIKKLIPSLIGGAYRLNTEYFPEPATPGSASLKDTVVNCKRLFEQGIANLNDPSLTKRIYETLENYRVRRKKAALKTKQSVPANPVAERVSEFDYPYDKQLAGATMPAYARKILSSSKLAENADLRRETYRQTMDVLASQARLRTIYPDLPETVVPWALPVRIHDREQIDHRLREIGVPVFSFGETLHPTFHAADVNHTDAFAPARALSRELLCIPVHQALTDTMRNHWASAIRELQLAQTEHETA